MGRCQYMACASLLGSSFRANFRLGSDPDAPHADYEVMLCPNHESELRPLRDKLPGRLVLTPEGYVYSSIWMDSLGFLV